MQSVAVILAAAGGSRRFCGVTPKQMEGKKTYIDLKGKPTFRHCIEKFAKRSDVKQIILLLAEEDIGFFREKFSDVAAQYGVVLVVGGKERADSIQNGLMNVRPDVDFVAIHDAARPCVSESAIEAVFSKAKEYGAAMLASPIVGTIKRAENSTVTETVPRDGLWEAQTPQVFARKIIIDAYSNWRQKRAEGAIPTDDAQLVEWLGHLVCIVPNDRWNLKITTPEDKEIAEFLLSK